MPNSRATGCVCPTRTGRPNSDVLKPWANGFELSRGPQHQWIIDFGNEFSETGAGLFEQPFSYVVARVKPERISKSRTRITRFLVADLAGQGSRCATRSSRLHGLLPPLHIPSTGFLCGFQSPPRQMQALIAVARADDATFGILHSRFHELWSLRMGTWLGVGNDPRYTPTTCFETFPFPEGLTPADTAHQRTEAIDGGALVPAGLSAPENTSKQALAHKGRAQAAIENRSGWRTRRAHRPRRQAPERPARELAQSARMDAAPARGDSAGHGRVARTPTASCPNTATKKNWPNAR